MHLVPLDGHPICIAGLDFDRFMKEHYLLNQIESIWQKKKMVHIYDWHFFFQNIYIVTSITCIYSYIYLCIHMSGTVKALQLK